METRPGPIRALLLDLGGTLERDGAVLPGVADALDVLTRLALPSGELLRVALISDYHDAPAGDPEEAERLFAEYIEIVRGLGLLRFFEPPGERMTISTIAGVHKPDRRIFEQALRRLGLPPVLEECLFVTEDAAHVAAARSLRIQALRLGPGGDIEDWTSALPILLRAMGFSDPESAARDFRRTLEDSGRIGPREGPLPPGATHVLEPGAEGGTELRRRRFNIR